MHLFDITFNGKTYVGVKEMMFVEGNLQVKGFDYEGKFYKTLVINPELSDFSIERSEIDVTKISMEEMVRASQSLVLQTYMPDMPAPKDM